MAGSGIAVPCNKRLKPLDELLGRVQRPGDFFVRGSIESPLPRLEIDGIGTISFPVPQQQAKALDRQQRKQARKNAPPRIPGGEDPDLVGIIPGPQPLEFE